MSSDLKCNICFDFYDSSDKKPIVLNCGHSLCKSCLVRLENRNCSTCRSEITQEDLEDIPVNYDLMILAKNRTEEEDDDENICQEHEMPKNCECTTHRMMLCAACGMVDHKQCETQFVGNKLSTKKRKFQQEFSDERDRIDQVVASKIFTVQRLTAKDTRNEKEIKILEAKILQVKEESIQIKAEFENKMEIINAIESWKKAIDEQMEKVQNSSLLSEFENNKQILVNLIDSFQTNLRESSA